MIGAYDRGTIHGRGASGRVETRVTVHTGRVGLVSQLASWDIDRRRDVRQALEESAGWWCLTLLGNSGPYRRGRDPMTALFPVPAIRGAG